MKRFQTLQWQLTAAYTLISLLILIIIFYGFGFGVGVYRLQSDILGNELLTQLQSALSQVELSDAEADVSEIAEGVFNHIFVTCISTPRPDSAFLFSSPDRQLGLANCPQRQNFYIGFDNGLPENNVIISYSVLKSVVLWTPEGTVVVDRNGRRTEPYQFSDKQLNMIERGQIGASITESQGLNAIVSSPVTIIDSETTQPTVVAVVFVETGFRSSPSVAPGGGPVYTIPALALLAFGVTVGIIASFWVTRRVNKRISVLGQLSEEWAAGNFTAVSQDSSADEIGQLGRRLNSMVEQLQNLLEARSQLTAVEERNKIARDLHDAAKQQIFAADMQLYAAEKLIENDPTRAKTHLQEARKLTKSIQSELSTLIAELRPAQLEGKGLFEAVRETAVSFQERNDIEVDLLLTGEQELPLNVEQPLYRLLQEALSNIARHSQASKVTVQLAV